MKNHLTLILLLAITAITANGQTKQQADSIYEASRNLANSGQIEASRPLALQAMEMYKTLCGETCDDYINALNVYAVSFGQEQNYKKAAEIELQVVNLCEKLDHQHPRINLFYENMGYFAYLSDDYPNGTKYWELALPFQEKYSDKYGHMIEGLAMMYDEMGDMEGVARMMELIEDHNKHELTLPCEEVKCMMDRAQYYLGVGNHTQAKEWYLKAVGIANEEEKIQVYEAYGQFLAMTMHDYTSGAEYTLSAAKLRKERNGEDEEYFNSLNKAGIYSFLGKLYQQAIDCYLPVVDFYQHLNSKTAKSNLAKCQKNLGNAYSGLKDYTKAKECFQQAVAYYETNDKDNKDYPKVLARLASAEKFNKEYEAAIEHYQQAMQIFEKHDMMEDYSNAASSLQLCYTYAGMDVEVDTNEDAIKAQRNQQLDQSIKELKEGLQITHDYLGDMAYANTLATIAGCYFLKEEYSQAVEYYKQYMPELRNAIRAEFQLQSEAERMSTWNREKTNMQQLREILINLPEGDEKLKNDLTALAYDAALLSKGILLNSSIEFEKLLAEQGDEQLKSVYAQIKANEEQIDWLRDNATSDADLNKILQLSQQNQALQLELYRGCKELADYTDYISYDWKAVQQTLEPNDVAIEFTTINPILSNADDIMVALVLTKDMENPIAVTIWDNENLNDCAETDFYKSLSDTMVYHGIRNDRDIRFLKQAQERLNGISTPYKSELSLFIQFTISKMQDDKAYRAIPILELMNYNQLFNNDAIYDATAAGDIVWGALSPYLEGKRRIFFSADGSFNHIGIEYLSYNGNPLSEQFEVYRLSSTKELCMHRQTQSLDHIVLIGDVNYEEKGALTEQTEMDLLALRGVDSRFDPLKSTKQEMDDIKAIMKSHSLDITMLSGTEATQSAFLRLSGSKANLIHIATHGAYLASNKQTEEESMQNCILAFAGANDYETTHDGILSAADIAKMDLRQCELAVLSACETGLGKLGDDGVFGLQRGFKNAGVRTLLMSTKKVYDQTTADMMVSFYRHLAEGLSMRESLVKAQQELRNNGYTDAKYWASFILLDAIE